MQKTVTIYSVMVLILLQIFIQPSAGYAQTLLNGPQKIVIDTKRDRLLVSNANSGDIIQIDNRGNQTFFIKGADFIDGMEIVGDTVYGVCSNRKIKAYSLVTRKLVADITFTGSSANYLSSVASDSSGHLFISCPLLNEIYKMDIKNLSYSVFARGKELNKPNGILFEKERNRIVVIDDSPNSKIHAIDLADSLVTTLLTTTFNSPDGIIRDKFGNYYVGGYYLSGIYRIDSALNNVVELFFKGTTMVYPTYDEKSHSILVTHYDANTWERIALSNFSITLRNHKTSKL